MESLDGWGLDLDVNGTRKRHEDSDKCGEGAPVTVVKKPVRRRRRAGQVFKDEAQSEAWDRFYSEKGIKFFKDRHNLRRFFSELMPESVRENPGGFHQRLERDGGDSIDEKLPPRDEMLTGMTVVIEFGCGVRGN